MTLVRIITAEGGTYAAFFDAEMPPPELDVLTKDSPDWETWLNRADRAYFIRTDEGQRVQLRHIVRAFVSPRDARD